MNWSRRDIGLLLPALAAAQLEASAAPQTAAPQLAPSLAFRFEDLTPKASGPLVSRQILNGLTHEKFLVDLHESELAPGQMPHPPHQHAHEEMLMIREGTMEATIMGKTTRLGPGSGVYVASNELHGWKNIGTTPAKYFVLALGADK